MFKNRYYNNSKKQITSYFKYSLFNKNSFSSQNNNKEKSKKRLAQLRNKMLTKGYYDSIKEYTMLKSVIHLKEQKETIRQKRLNETVYNIKNLERDINYTNILKFMDIAFNKDNPFKSYNLKNKIDELENFSKTIYRNKIGIILNKKILHGAKIKCKVDSGNKKELDFDRIYQKIKDSKDNFQKTRLIKKRNNPKSKAYYTTGSSKSKNISDYLGLNKKENEKKLNINKSIISDKTINNEIINLNHVKKNNTNLPRAKSEFNLFNSSGPIRVDKKPLSQKFIFHRNKKVELNENDKIWSKNSSINQSFSSNSYYRPISKMNYKNQIVKIKSENRKSNIKSKDKMNRTIVNSKSKIKKYKLLVNGLYNDFHKIKSNSAKLLNKYKEWGFSSGKEIDEIVKTKEDMLLFHLKQKYFKNMKLFPKYQKRKRLNISLANKIKHGLEIIDDDVKRY